MARGPVGAFAEGFVSGVGLRRQQEAFEEEKQTNKLRREGLELELRKRRADLEDADRVRDADAWYLNANEGIIKATTAAEAGNRDALTNFQFQDFSEFRASRKPSQPQPTQPAPQTGIAGLVAGIRRGVAPSEAAPEAAGIAAPAGETAEMPAARGVQPPAGAQPSDDQKETPRRNPFIPAGAKAPDVYEQRIRLQGQALERYFNMKGKPEKALEVPGVIRGLLKQNWEERLGTSVPMALAMSRDGLRRLSEINDVLPNGFKFDPETGTPDAKSRTWKGVMITNESTGEQSPMDITPEMLLAITKRYDVAGAAKDIIEYGDKRASERRAEADVLSRSTTALANLTRAQTADRRAAAADSAAVDAARENQRIKAAKFFFPLARPSLEITPEEEMRFSGKPEEVDAKRKNFLKRIDDDNAGSELMMGLVAGNPKVPSNTLGALARDIISGKGEKVKIETDKDGRTFVTYKGQRVNI